MKDQKSNRPGPPYHDSEILTTDADWRRRVILGMLVGGFGLFIFLALKGSAEMAQVSSWFWFLTYPIGLALFLIFEALGILGYVRVRDRARIPRRQPRMLIVANHPSFLEPLLLPFVFGREFIFRPGFAPWSTPRQQFFRPWWWFWIRPRAVVVPRGEPLGRRRALMELKRILLKGGRVIIFAEGGRTFKGNEFVESVSGRRLRPFYRGAGWLALATNTLILPIWVEGTEQALPPGEWKPRFSRRQPIIIKIGRAFRLPPPVGGCPEQTATVLIQNALLALADQ